MGNIYKEIYNKIKKNNKIIIARHIGADPDALASSIALKEIILSTFPNKKVLVIGQATPKFSYFGEIDKLDNYDLDSLVIVTDTPDLKRIDGVDPRKYKDSIKIDHHPFIDKTCNLEWIDDTSSSASEMIVRLVYNTKLVMEKSAAEKLYLGIVADTNRFLFKCTGYNTFMAVSNLQKDYDIDITSLYDKLYFRDIKDRIFESYIINNLTITENGLAYLKISNNTLKEYGVDAATAGNMINNFNYINEFIVWALFSEDVKNNNIRGSIRSRGPIINDVASGFNGGGHNYASGAKPKNFDEVDKLIKALDERCMEYQKKSS